MNRIISDKEFSVLICELGEVQGAIGAFEYLVKNDDKRDHLLPVIFGLNTKVIRLIDSLIAVRFKDEDNQE